MTRFGRFLLRSVERLVGTWREGPEMPARFVDYVVEFARFNPAATRIRWATFAAEVARAAYEAGYARGYEWAERDPSVAAAGDPDELIAQVDPGGDWLRFSVELPRPGEVPGDEEPKKENPLAAFVRDMEEFDGAGEEAPRR